jgi:flagellar biosynthesis GTPase FlhF
LTFDDEYRRHSLNNDESSLYKRLADVISTHLGKAAPITIEKKTGSWSLPAPPVSEKTTTIAKMAAYFKLWRKKHRTGQHEVFRIGGIAQLRTYGVLIDIPVFALRDPGI